MFCYKCGSKLPDGANFCVKCGANISNNSVPDTSMNNLDEKTIDNEKKQSPDNRYEAVNNQKPKKKYGCLTACLIGIIVLLLFFKLSNLSNLTNKSSDPESVNTKSTATIEKTVLYSENGVTITVLDLSYNSTWDSFCIKTKIENNTAKTIIYSMNEVIINGYSLESMAFGDVYSENNAIAELAVAKSDLDLATIKNIMEIDFTIHCYYSDSKEDICFANAKLKTSDYGKYEQDYSPQGILAYDSKGLKVYVKPNAKDKINEPAIIYMENNTDRKVSVSYKNVSYNGTMVQQIHSGFNIQPNSRKITKMKISMFSYEHDTTSLDKMSFTLIFLPMRADGVFSTADSFESEIITVNYN